MVKYVPVLVAAAGLVTQALAYVPMVYGWCDIANKHAYVIGGDFDGDGKPDQICAENSFSAPSQKRRWIKLGNGRMWHDGGLARWCSGKRQFMTIEDANSDGKDDLVCRDIDPTRKGVWVKYGTASGRFSGNGGDGRGHAYIRPDMAKYRSMPPPLWCSKTTMGSFSRVMVGQFDADGYLDFLCMDDYRGNRAGRRYFWFSGGKQWFEGGMKNWCNQAPDNSYKQWVQIQDVNGDGVSEILCKQELVNVMNSAGVRIYQQGAYTCYSSRGPNAYKYTQYNCNRNWWTTFKESTFHSSRGSLRW